MTVTQEPSTLSSALARRAAGHRRRQLRKFWRAPVDSEAGHFFSLNSLYQYMLNKGKQGSSLSNQDALRVSPAPRASRFCPSIFSSRCPVLLAPIPSLSPPTKPNRIKGYLLLHLESGNKIPSYLHVILSRNENLWGCQQLWQKKFGLY